MDNDTTLVIFGDHGMTVGGSHGGNSEEEIRSALFAYQKTPMAFGKTYRKYQEKFKQLDSNLKQVDVATIAAILTNTPIPFSNLGIVHPAFVQAYDLKGVVNVMRENLTQV